MNGDFLRKKIELSGFQLVEVAKNMNITPQDLQSKLKSKDVKISFLEKLASSINKDVYYFFEDSIKTKSTDIVNQENYYDADDKFRRVSDMQNLLSDKFVNEDFKTVIQAQKNVIDELKEQVNFYKFKDTHKQIEIEERLKKLEEFMCLMKMILKIDIEIDNIENKSMNDNEIVNKKTP